MIHGRVAGRIVVACYDDDERITGHIVLHDKLTGLPFARTVEGPLVNGCIAVTFENSPHDDEKLVKMVTDALAAHVSPK